MKVVCTRVPSPLDGVDLESSSWVTVDREYTVLAISAEFGGRVQLQLLTDDGRSLGWFDANCFLTVDTRLPRNWTARVGEGGAVELAPEPWLADGFWEAYYDGDVAAAEAVEAQLATILGEDST